MATYTVVELAFDLVPVLTADVYDFKPSSRLNIYDFVAAEPIQSGFPSSPPTLNNVLWAEEYVWVGPGGDTDSEHAYWG